MPIDTEARIRDRAHALWETAGCPGGNDKDFWSAAERQLAEESDLDLCAEDAQTRLPLLQAGLPVH